MNKALIALLAAFVVGATCAAAGARTYRTWTSCTVSIPARAELACGTYHLKHSNDVLRFLANHPTAGTARSRARVRRDHLWLRRFALSKVTEARRRLAPPRPAVGHLAMWECIHAGEGAWNAQTGNGYYGGLQMTYGWMGLVGNAALLSPAAQMAAAEAGWRANDYSLAWLFGQWPNTAPPCV